MSDICLSLLLNNMIFKKRIIIIKDKSVVLSKEEGLSIFAFYKYFPKELLEIKAIKTSQTGMF